MLDDLLKILIGYGLDLLIDSRTLKEKPRDINTSAKCGREFIYLGLKKALHKYSEKFDHDEDNVKLAINIDGIPLFKSSSMQLWLYSYIAISSCFFCENQKPDPVDDYLEEFLLDLVELRKDGYKYNRKTLNVELHFFACDAPPRVALKCIVGHTGYDACERCNIKGNWVSSGVTFDEAGDFEMRTHEGFTNKSYSSHQKKESPLIQRNICCIISFVLDYMHLVCLGVTRRILNFLRKGPAVSCLSHAKLALVSEHLVSLRGNIP